MGAGKMRLILHQQGYGQGIAAGSVLTILATRLCLAYLSRANVA
jgi:hypothetical protein